MSQPFTLYGATHCDDTQHARELLAAWGLPDPYVNIDHDSRAEAFVIFINAGNRSTPTLVFGAGRHKVVLTEPSDGELKEALLQAGYHLE
jgi:glutaredoxin